MGSVFVFGLIASAGGCGWIDLPAPIAQSISPAGYMKALLMIGGVFMVFVLGVFIFVRSSRRYRRRLLHERPPPTPSVDIWKMHRLPDDDADTESESEPDDPPADDGSNE